MPLADPTTWPGAAGSCSTRGIDVALAFYPASPRDEVGFPMQVTAANADEQVTELLAALDGWPTSSPPPGLVRRNRPALSGVIPAAAGKVVGGEGGAMR